MSSRSPGTGKPGHQRCQLILQRCVAIQLAKPGNAPDDFWMYDSGYLLFQVCAKLPFHQNSLVDFMIHRSA